MLFGGYRGGARLVEIADSADPHPQRHQHFGDLFGIVVVDDVALGDCFLDEGGDGVDPCSPQWGAQVGVIQGVEQSDAGSGHLVLGVLNGAEID